MKLFITEKPSVGRTLASVLGNHHYADTHLLGDGWAVSWCFGHLFTPKMPQDYNDAWSKWLFDDLPLVPERWEIKPVQNASNQIKALKALIKDAKVIINAGDADREGQLIVDELLSRANWDGPTSRLWITDMTTKGIQSALDKTKDNHSYRGLYCAGLARQRADWLVGMNYTRAYTIQARKQGFDDVLSVGRVQTPTLAMIVERDLAIESFISIPFYEVQADFKHETGNYQGTLRLDDIETDDEGRLIDRVKAETLCESANASTYRIQKISVKKKTAYPPLLHTLTSLQAEASKALSISAQAVLDTAQSLYETHKLISYPRTDSPYITHNQADDIPDIITAFKRCDWQMDIVNAADFERRSKSWNDKKASAESHTGIVPTDGLKLSSLEKLTDTERGVYQMITRRYLIQFLDDNITEETSFDTVSDHDPNFAFITKGNRTLNVGWKAYIKTDAKSTETLLDVNVKQNDTAACIKTNVVEKSTTPPKPFTEDTIVVAMKNVARTIDNAKDKKILKEVGGIGTSATRGAIIETLKNRGYVVSNKTILSSTLTARDFIAHLPKSITSVITTALWESKLSEIESDPNLFTPFFDELTQSVSRHIASVLDEDVLETKNLFSCPTCGSGVLRRRKSRFGFFWGCSRYSDGCRATFKDNEGEPLLDSSEKDEKTTQPCPHFECDGQAIRYKRKKKLKGYKSAYFWICRSCEQAGRTKFLNDVNGKPVLQD